MLHIKSSGGRWRRACTQKREDLVALRSRAERATNREVADLSSYFTLKLPPHADTERVLDLLNALPEVELANPAPLRVDPPSVPDFGPLQGYLDSSPGGLDARYAWSFPGGTGTGVAICDMEYGWNLNHDDLPPATVMIPDGETLASLGEDDHGTEVLGTMFSLANGWGTTGASYDARCFVAPVWLDSGFALFQQILWAASRLEPGDVILLESQTAGPLYDPDGHQAGYVPIEWIPSIHEAIVTAVGNGIHVVEGAGNGAQRLDDPIYVAGNYGFDPFLPENDSGAILVGAGIPPVAPELGPDRSRSVFSNFGSRLDVQGWGHRVTTTGAGDLYSSEGPNLLYTRYFGGTSSAAPLVASAVASIEGIAEHATGRSVDPMIMRALLRDTGIPQQDGARPAALEPIGPRPDLKAAIQRMSAPFVAAPRVVHAYEGDSVHFTVHAAILDGGSIMSLTASPLSMGMSFSASGDNASGTLDWTPSTGQAGAYTLVFTAADGVTATDTTLIQIDAAERPPLVIGPGGELGIEAGPPIRITMRAIDPNGDPIVSFTSDGLPRGASFAVDSTWSTGVFTWIPDYDQAGVYTVPFTAVSMSSGGQEKVGHGLLGLTIFNHDRTPVVSAPRNLSRREGELISFEVTAADADGDAITSLDAYQMPQGASFESDPSHTHGTFTWTPDFDQEGAYLVQFQAQNAALGPITGTYISVANVDRAPIVSAPSEVRGTEGVELTVDATATDPDLDPIATFTADGLPPGAELSTGVQSARISWTPHSGQAGIYRVRLVAFSSTGILGLIPSDSAGITLTIESGHFAARVYSLPGQATIKLGPGRATTCLCLEPVGSDFELARVAAASLTWSGAGSDLAIPGQIMGWDATDLDHNDVPDLSVCFSKEALRSLFARVPGNQPVEGVLRGTLQGGGTFEGAVNLQVLPERGAVALTPNPSRGNSIISFYTSRDAPIWLRIFDSRGGLVRVLLDGSTMPNGFHDVPVEASGQRLPVGIYHYKLETVDGTTTGKLAVLR